MITDPGDLLPHGPSLWERLATRAIEVAAPRPEQLDASTLAAERSLEEFVVQAWHTIEPTTPLVRGWVIGCICAHLEAVYSGEIRDLIVCVPPGAMKSVLCCVMWPSWVWIREPGFRWIFGAYGQGLAFRDSDRMRDVISSEWYRARWGNVFGFKQSWNTKERFSNTRGGYRISTTVAGKAMGERAHAVCYDDAIKPTEIGSEAIRGHVIRSWTQTMATRGSDPRTVRKVVVGQRLHERDLPGYLMSEVGGYETLILPMEYEPARYFLPSSPDVRLPRDAIVPTSLQRRRPELRDGPEGSGRRFPGDLLWPERFPAEEVEKLKGTLAGVGSAGQLQQRPSAAEGTLFKAQDFRHFTVESDVNGNLIAVLGVRESTEQPEPLRIPVDSLRFFQTIDTALTNTPTSAYTCVATFAWHLLTRNLLVWDVWRARLEVREQMEAIQQMRQGKGHWDIASRRWAIPSIIRPWPRPLLYQAVESKASGYGILQQARADGIPLLELKAIGDKAQRAAPAVTMARNGKLWFRAAASWLTDYEEELLSAPYGAYADAFDCTAYGCMQANTETLLNAAVEGDLLCWPPTPVNLQGRPLSPEEVATHNPDAEVLSVGGVEIEFADRDPDAWWDTD